MLEQISQVIGQGRLERLPDASIIQSNRSRMQSHTRQPARLPKLEPGLGAVLVIGSHGMAAVRGVDPNLMGAPGPDFHFHARCVSVKYLRAKKRQTRLAMLAINDSDTLTR